MANNSRGAFWGASLLFFFSGATGLAYEVIWFKRFAHVWGGSSVALAAVVASFLCGLGVGARIIGHRADRMPVPLRWYGYCEIAIGLLALLVPWEIQALLRAGTTVDRMVLAWPIVRFLVQFLLTLAVIGPPTFLMGGTLPLLVRQFSRPDQPLSDSTGWFYALNTFGAAVGCVLAGFWLLPTIGLFETNNLTALGNVLVGLAGLGLAKTLRLSAPTPRAATKGAVAARGSAGSSDADVPAEAGDTSAFLPNLRVYVASAMAGCGALVLQIVWNRQLAIALGGSTYAFSATLFTVLTSIALGSLLYHWVLRRRFRPENVLLGVVALMGVGVIASQWCLPELCLWVGSVQRARVDPTLNALICIAVGMAIQYVPSLGSGVLFPLFAQLTREVGASAGRVIGNLYAWNTVGSIAGAMVTGMLLFPTIGTAGASVVAVVLFFVSALVVFPHAPGRPAMVAGGFAALGLAMALVVSRGVDIRRTNLGLYLYGAQAAISAKNVEVLFFREGPSSNVVVSKQNGNTSLRVNGKVDASTGLDMETQIGLAYFPRMFKPDAREVAIIGFGSGVTSGAALQFPDTRVVCCEIEPAVAEASPFFAAANHRPQDSPNFSLVIGDGRSFLQSEDRKFDLIISEPSNPWLAGVSSLFSQDFFHTVRDKLTPDGVLAQWVQTYNFNLSEYALIVRTLRSVFPHVSMISLAKGADTILLASNSPLELNQQKLDLFQSFIDSQATIGADFEKYFYSRNVRWLLLKHYPLDTTGLQRAIAAEKSTAINTDLNLRLEFDAPLRLFQTENAAATALQNHFLKQRNREWIDQLSQQLGVGPRDWAYHLALGNLAFIQPDLEGALKAMVQAQKLDPKATEVDVEMTELYQTLGKTDYAITSYLRVVQRHPDDGHAHEALGTLYTNSRRPKEAEFHYSRAIEINPKSLLAINNLAWLLATTDDDLVRDGKRALELSLQACDITNYSQAACLDTLAAAMAEVGNFPGAVNVASTALRNMEESNPPGTNLRETIEPLQRRLQLYQAGKPFHQP